MTAGEAPVPAISGEPALSVVIPVHNNAGTLEALHARLTAVLRAWGQPFEVVFVDDASADGSLAVLHRLAESDVRTRLVPMPRNVGQHQAILAGMAAARGAWTLTLDADLQDPPEAVPRLLEQCGAGYAAVFGGRRGRYESPGRLLTSRVYKRLQHWVSGVPVDASLFVVVNAPLKAVLIRMQGPIVVAIGCAGLPMISVPVERAARPEGASSYTARGRLRSAWRSLRWALAWKWRARGGPAEGMARNEGLR